MSVSFGELLAFLGAIACLGSLLAVFAELASSARSAWVVTGQERQANANAGPRPMAALEPSSPAGPRQLRVPQGDRPDLNLRRQRHIQLLLNLRRDLRVQGYRPPQQRRCPTMMVVCCRLQDRARS
jgi:hypothetical protein